MKLTLTAAFAATALAMAGCSDSGSSEFAGTWKVADTGGKPFEIVLAADGTAKADREGEGMDGTWKKDGTSAVITWKTGWTTKITKDGDKFTKVAYEKGGSDGAPKNSSTAEKVK
ncbi:MAG: hypothetical protein Q7T86_01820 [Hyphomicrobiaceae bacterium]|nr:hypothetical protein [Hyphomicrobiaceae bacterium]